MAWPYSSETATKGDGNHERFSHSGTNQSIQLHGGTGFTWEFDLHLFLRRVKAIEVTYKPSVVDADQLIEAAGTGSV